ncbi:MAG: hypothetical protein WCB04_12310 [Mycobacteriales bacterium]
MRRARPIGNMIGGRFRRWVTAVAVTPSGVRSSWLVTRAAFAIGLVVAHLGARKALLPGDVAVVYFDAASHLMHGAVPYVDFQYEYPPGTLPLLAFAWLLGGPSRASFVIAWCVLMLVLDGVVTWRLSRSRFGAEAGLLWVVGVCLLGPTALLRNDLVVVASFVIAFGLTAHRGTVTGGALWMIGVLAKIWPFAPMAALFLLRRPGRARLALGALVLFGGTAALLLANGSLGAMVGYLLHRQGRRPLEIESLWATPVWMKALLTGGRVTVEQTSGSENLIGAHSAATAATLLTGCVQLACVFAPFFIVRRTRIPISASLLAWIFATYVAITLVAAPVESPQYAAWLLSAACVLVTVSRSVDTTRFALLTLLVCALTQLVFPTLFDSLQDSDPVGIVVLLLRNVTLLTVCGVGIRGLLNSIRSATFTTVVSDSLAAQHG